MFLGRNIRYLRKSNHMSQEQLAAHFGYKSPVTIQKWESGHSTPPVTVVEELSAMFNVSIDDMLLVDLSEPTPEKIVSLTDKECMDKFLEAPDNVKDIISYILKKY